MKMNGKLALLYRFLQVMLVSLAIVSVMSVSSASIEQSADAVPKNDSERAQFVNDLRTKGLSDEEIAQEIIAIIKSAPKETEKSTVEPQKPLLTADEIQRKLQELETTIVSTEIKNASPEFWIILVADDTQKDSLISEIRSSDIDPDEKKNLEQSLSDIWLKYPVKFTKTGNTLYIDFDMKDTDSILTKTDNETLARVSEIHEEIICGGGSPKWATTPGHADIIYWAIYENAFPSHPLLNYADYAASHAGDPDLGLPWNVYDHYYNPEWGTGGAPSAAAFAYTQALWNLNVLDYNESAKQIAYSSHYMSDVGNPWHTGYELNTTENQTGHYRYEGWVSSHWTTPGFVFRAYVRGNADDYLWDLSSGSEETQVADSTIRIAESSHRFIDQLFIRFWYWTDQQLENDDWSREVTRVCLATTSKYVNGLADRWLVMKFPSIADRPTDPDLDRFYEDINGNSRKDFNDVALYWQNVDWIDENEPHRLFDYTGDGYIDMDDVMALWYEI